MGERHAIATDQTSDRTNKHREREREREREGRAEGRLWMPNQRQPLPCSASRRWRIENPRHVAFRRGRSSRILVPGWPDHEHSSSLAPLLRCRKTEREEERRPAGGGVLGEGKGGQEERERERKSEGWLRAWAGTAPLRSGSVDSTKKGEQRERERERERVGGGGVRNGPREAEESMTPWREERGEK